MSCMEDVLKIGKKLEKMISTDTQDHAAALDMLTTLKKLPMTLDVLQKTRIGMTVNNFRKSTKNEEVISLSKSLIKIWKKLLADGPNQASSGGLSRSSSIASNLSREGDDSRDSGDVGDDKKDKETKKEGEDEKPAQKPTFAARASDTGDSIRLKCREMLSKALEIPPDAAGNSAIPDGAGDKDEIAAAIEECIFQEFKNTDSKYKNRVRSRVANLKDVKNPQLRENVLLGQISPDRIAVMSSLEMANDSMKKLREEYTKQAINDHQMAVTTGTVTDLLKCGKCLKRKCAYNQVQTRSADEPMTTFVLCLDCGHRWKFC